MHVALNAFDYAGTSLSRARIQRLKSVSFHRWAAINLVGDMSNEEEDPHPHPTPHWSSGVESWSDMSNEEEDPQPPTHPLLVIRI